MGRGSSRTAGAGGGNQQQQQQNPRVAARLARRAARQAANAANAAALNNMGATDLAALPDGTVLYSSNGTVYIRQSSVYTPHIGLWRSDVFTVQTTNGRTLTGTDSAGLARRLRNGRVKLVRKGITTRRDGFGNYIL